MSTQNPPTPQTPRKKRRWGRALLLTTVVVLGLLALSVELLRIYGERTITERAQEAAERRGWSVQWDSLSLNYDLTLDIENLDASGPGGASVAFERLSAKWTLDQALVGQRVPESITIEAPNARLSPDTLQSLRGSSKPDKAPKNSDSPQRQDEPSALLGLTIKITQGSLEIFGLPWLENQQWRDLEVDGAPDPDSWGWKAAATGRCAEGCGQPLKMTATVKHHMGTALDVELDKHFTIHQALPQLDKPLDAGVRKLSVTHSAAEGVHLKVGDITASTTARGIGIKAEIQEASAHIATGQRRPERVLLTAPSVTVDNVPWSIPDLGPHLSTPEPVKPALRRRTKRKRSKTPDPTIELRDKLHRILTDLKEPAQGALKMLSMLEVQGGTFHWPAEDLRVTSIDAAPNPQDGSFKVLGNVGELRLGGEVLPEAPYVMAAFEGVSVAQVRTLVPRIDDRLKAIGPLRGLSGKVSGRVGLVPEQTTVTPEPKPSSDKRKRPALKPIERVGTGLRADIVIADGHLDINGLTPKPITATEIKVALDAVYWWPDKLGDEAQIRELAVTLPSRQGGQATLKTSVRLKHLRQTRKKHDAWVKVWTDEIDCAVAVGAIPEAMLPNLHNQLKVQGTFAPAVTFSINMRNLHSAKLDVQGLPGTCKVTELGEFDPAYLKTDDFKQEVTEGVTREGIFVGPGTGSYVPLRALPKHLQVATYVSEEWNFYKNKGFDIQRTTGAIRLNIEHGRYVYGGSTVTQQLVKNLFLSRQKTLSRKLEEAFIVWKVEEILSKERILELYLNCIEFAPNVYGITRAARFYFGKSPSRLSLLESAFLAGIKPKPGMGLGPLSKGRTPETGYWPERLYRVLLRMTMSGHLSSKRVIDMAPYTVYFKTWGGPRPSKQGALPPGFEGDYWKPPGAQ